MKKISIILGAVAICLSIQMIVPNKSEAGVTCRTDAFGNLVCNQTNSWGMNTGNSSTTRTDAFGNDITTFNNSWGQPTGTMTCRTDAFGNYNCN